MIDEFDVHGHNTGTGTGAKWHQLVTNHSSPSHVNWGKRVFNVDIILTMYCRKWYASE